MNIEEKRTVEKMIRIYCKAKHKSTSVLCDECNELNEYANQRLSRCCYGNNKPTCEKCPTHCYKPKMREQIQAVMRYGGPRMILHHPILAIKHLMRSRKRMGNV